MSETNIQHEGVVESGDKNMSKNLIVLTLIVVILGCLIGFIAFRIHQRSVISQGRLLFEQGKYQEVIDNLGPDVQGTSYAADERMLVARSQYRLGRYQEAQETLQPLLVFGQEDPRAIALSGWLFLEEGSFLKAQSKFMMLSDLGKKAKAEAGLAGVALLRSEGRRKSELNEAEIHIREAINLDQSIPEAYLVLSELKTIRNDYEAAIESAQKAVELSPHWSKPYVALGKAYLGENRSQEAEEAFKKAGASEEETQYYLALSMYYQGRLNESLEIFDQLSSMESELAKNSLNNAAKIQVALGENEKAIRNLREVINRFELDPTSGMQLFEIYARQKRYEEGERLLREIVSDWPFIGEAQLERGNLLLQQNDLREAYDAYRSVLDSDQTNYWAYYNLGCISVARSELYQAPEYFEASLRDIQNFFSGEINLALSLLAVGRESDAILILQNLNQNYPENPLVLNARALERFHAGYPDISLQLLDESLQSQPDQPLSFIIRGEIFLRLYQFEKARDSFLSALKKDPENYRAQVGLGHAFFRLGMYQEAETIYSRLLKEEDRLVPEMYTEVRNGNALILAKSNDLATALKIWDTLEAISEISRQLAAVNSACFVGNQPTQMELDKLETAAQEKNPIPESFFNLAYYQASMEKESEAVTTYQALLEQYDSYLPALYNYANLQNRRGLFERAVELYQKARKGNPERIDLLNNEAVSSARLQDTQRAKELLDEAQELNPNSVNIRFNQFILAVNSDEIEEAQEILTQSKSLGIPISVLRLMEGLLESKRNNWVKAESLFEQAAQYDAMDAYALLNQGITLVKLENYSEAEQILIAAREVDSSLPAIHRALGLLYCHMGLFEEAQESLHAALRLDPNQNDLQNIIKQIQEWQMAS